MKNFLSLFLLAFLSATTVFSQNKKDILLTINDAPVYGKEFKRVYQKNLDLVQDESQKDIDGYLQLFIDYKLKVEEAKAQGLDKNKEYLSELSKYRDQLSRQYLAEDQFSEELTREAFERGKEEINASHILILANYEAMPQDTLAAYNKIKKIRERALKGEDFTELAKKNSEEPNANKTGGELGYFSAFKMVYPFETEAYNTPVGGVSNIVRTQFGYHLIKVKDRRKKSPKIEVSHIMISDQKKERNFDSQERIQEIYTLLKQGESFESLAKQYSDDKGSGAKGGELKPFTKGDLRAPEFEEAAYSLKTPGEISKPVKTDFGWHIIKLIEIMPEETYESQKEMLDKKMEGGDRSTVIHNAVNKKIKDEYGFKNVESYTPYFNTYVTDDVLKRKWTMTPIPAADNKTLFIIGDKSYHYSDFADYISARQKTTRPAQDKDTALAVLYDEFLNLSLTDYYKERLEVENEAFATVLDEYRNGLLIFDVMNINIWQKAKDDSLGIQNYYNKTKDNYSWKQRVEADVYSATSKNIALKIQGMLNSGKTPEQIKLEVNVDKTINTLITSGTFEIDADELPKGLNIKKGISDIYNSNDSFIVVNIKDVLKPGVKSLDEVKGRVLSDFQNNVEKEWVESLRSKYKVVINQKTLKSIKKELK